MKSIVIVSALFTLTGCVQVDRYQDVIKAPAPAELAGYWQTKGPQNEMRSPDAVATLVIAKDGDTFDCRQWQRVIALPGKLMLRGERLYNVTSRRDIYPIERDGGSLRYDRMTLARVERLTPECEQAWKKASTAASVRRQR